MRLSIDDHGTARCVRELLARSPIGAVERCTCGALHLSVGALSLRIDVAVLRAIVVMGSQALGRIHQLEEERPRLDPLRSRGSA